MLTLIGVLCWLLAACAALTGGTGIMAAAGLDAAKAQRGRPAAIATIGMFCAVMCVAGLAGLVAAPSAAILGIFTAVADLYLIRVDVREAEDRTVGVSARRAFRAIGVAFAIARQFLRDTRRKNEAASDSALPPLRSVPPLEAGPGRTPPSRRRAAPPPAPPDADPAPAPGRPRFAVASAVIPPDHAAAHQRIANFEPAGLPEHIDFMTREARGFAGYLEAFGTYADGLIHGPGVHPAALRATFDFADGFSDVAASLQLAVKRTLDYFQGHLEWAEAHDPTRDGHWTIRE